MHGPALTGSVQVSIVYHPCMEKRRISLDSFEKNAILNNIGNILEIIPQSFVGTHFFCTVSSTSPLLHSHPGLGQAAASQDGLTSVHVD